MFNPAQFVAQVRAEGAKVVWPSRREAGMTTIMVFIMALLVALFFFVFDQILSIAVDFMLSL